MSRCKANKQNKLVLPPTGDVSPETLRLPYNGNVVLDDGIAFSFACFDRGNKYFNLGGNSEDKTVGGLWFIKLLDCLKDVGTKTIQELKQALTNSEGYGGVKLYKPPS